MHGNPGLDANDNSSHGFSQSFVYAEGKDSGALIGKVTKALSANSPYDW